MIIPKFENKKDELAYVRKNKSQIIELKKAQLKHGLPTNVLEFKNDSVIKSLTTNFKDDVSGAIKRELIASTYYWMDSHRDVHVGFMFKKSIEERTKKVFHLHDHKHEITATVGTIEKLEERLVPWIDLGVSKNGETICLIATSDISKEDNEKVFNLYKNGKVDQHSVGMVYVNIGLASNDADYPEEKALWDMYYSLIGNQEEVDKYGYFWCIKEAKLIEISAVLMGSNELTNTVENIEPSNVDTQKQADENHLEKSKKELLKSLI
jgi:hypothetical protein